MSSGKPIPPGRALKLLRSFLRKDLTEEVMGDLEERFDLDLKTKSALRAKLNYWYQVLNYMRPFALRKPRRYTNRYPMFEYHIRIGWRNLLKNRGHAVINIGGLAIGMTVAMLNALWIWDEISFNKDFENYDRIVQVTEKGIREEGGFWEGTSMTYPLSTTLLNDYSQHFERLVRTRGPSDAIMASGDVALSAKGQYADTGAPEMFSFRMIEGSRAGLAEPNAIFLSASLARSIFGDESAVNHTLRFNSSADVIVKGIYEDFAHNTVFYGVKFFAPWPLFLQQNPWAEKRAVTDWRNHFMQIYLVLHPSSDVEVVKDQIKGALQFDPADKEDAEKRQQHLSLYPMSRWHLFPTYHEGAMSPSHLVRLIGGIGLFVLMLACINFINLSTARSEKRAREVGIRKSIGSVRSQLIGQFFTESFLVVLLAFAITVLLATLSLPWFNLIANKDMVMPLNNPWFWILGLGFVLMTGFFAGIYPALYLSSFDPVRALKGTFRVGLRASVPRKVMVVVQFSISVILIISTVVVHKQLQFAQNRPVGYDRDGLLMIRKKSYDYHGKFEVLRTELKNTGLVYEISESMGAVTEAVSGNGGWDWKGRDPNLDESFRTLSVSRTHGRTAGWQFVDGRDFSEDVPADSAGIIINESVARLMGMNTPIGEPLTWTWWTDQRVMNYTIIGVIRDMVMESPYKPVRPTVFYLKGFNGSPNYINIKINPRVTVHEALPQIEKVFKKIIPSVPFDYQFADVEYANKFAAEQRMGTLASIFATLAILISCLGMLGLASFQAERRTKEIGIRKVLGASVSQLWSMLSSELVRPVIISCLVAAPAAWYFLNSWLMNYAYRTHLSWWIFIASGAGALAITLATVSFQAIKAALANPVISLKSGE